jgi:diacylglycerol kinase family enzyme
MIVLRIERASGVSPIDPEDLTMPAPSLLIIANIRGKRRAERFSSVLGQLHALGAETEVKHVETPGDAAKFAAAAVHAWRSDSEKAPTRLVVAGGDGTFNDVINGLDGAHIPVAFLPLGTANVLAYELDLPKYPTALARIIVEGTARLAHTGRVNGRLFILMAGIGIDAEVCERINRRSKALFRKGAYVKVTIDRWFAYFPRRYRIVVDGVVHHAASAVVTNAGHYAGPFLIAPEAGLDKPELHVCLYLTPGRMSVIRYGLGMITGRLYGMKDYKVVAGRTITIQADDGLSAALGDVEADPVQADGDVVTHLPAEISLADEQVMLVRR